MSKLPPPDSPSKIVEGASEINGYAHDKDLPAALRHVLSQSRSSPLPREEYIDQLLDRFLPSTDSTTVAITASEGSQPGSGIGKTTLAAMVAAHPSIRSNYCVLWLHLDHRSGDFTMTYEHYLSYLDSLCEQLGTKHKWPQPDRALEESSLRQKREEEKMISMKNDMRLILERTTKKNVLVVLDDAIDDQEIDWFWFTENQSLLATTFSKAIDVDWTLTLSSMSESEAINLFMAEAGCEELSDLSSSSEAKSIVRRCEYHPLTVRTVARWFGLGQAKRGTKEGMIQLDQDLSSCLAKIRQSRNKQVDQRKVLAQVMNIMLRPVSATREAPTTLMNLFLCSLAVVFTKEVPMEAAELLWSQLLHSEPDAVHEIGDNVTPSQIQEHIRHNSESLISLGLLSTFEIDGVLHIDIHHELQAEYAVRLLRKMQLSAATSTETARRWHGIFVSSYLDRMEGSQKIKLHDPVQAYAFDKLIHHMIKARMYDKAVMRLQDEHFIIERIEVMKWEKAISSLVADCAALKKAMRKDNTIQKNPYDTITTTYLNLGKCIAKYGKSTEKEVETASALHSIGFSLAEIGQHADAISQYKTALEMVPKSSIIAGTILYSCCVVYLIQRDYEKVLKNVKECIKVINENDKNGELYAEVLMLKAEAMMLDHDYQGAMEFFNFALEAFSKNSTNKRVQIGIVLGRQGHLYQLLGEIDNAHEALSKCIEWKEKISESSFDLAGVYNFMGDVCVLRGNRKDALLYFDLAYRMYESHMEKELLEEYEIEIHILNGKTDNLNDDKEGCYENFDIAIETMKRSQRPNKRTIYNLQVMARTYAKIEDQSMAMKLLEQCLQLTKERSELSLERAGILFDKGDLHLDMNDFGMALQCYQESFKIKMQKIGQSPAVVSTLLKIVRLHRIEENWEEALSFVKKALDVTERVYGENDDRVGDVLFELADIQFKMNRYMEAMNMFSECLEFRRKQSSDSRPDVAEALEGLGKVHLEMEDYEKAYQCLVEALEIRQATMEEEHPDTASTFHLLGVIERKLGDYERALHFLLSSLHIRKTQKEQGDTAMTLTEIGHVHMHLEDDFSAICCYEKSIDIVTQSYGKSDTRLIGIYLPLGNVKWKQGSVDEAKECYEIAVQISKVKNRNSHHDTGIVSRNLGFLQFQNKIYDEALENLENFVKIQEATQAKKSANFVLALQFIGDIHKYQNSFDKASTALKTANKIYWNDKDLSREYPLLGDMLDRRLSEENNESNLAPPSLFHRISEEITRFTDENKFANDAAQIRDKEIKLMHSFVFES